MCPFQTNENKPHSSPLDRETRDTLPFTQAVNTKVDQNAGSFIFRSQR